MKKLWTSALMIVLLAGSAFSAFIQSPIPPSSRENYLVDSDKDGRLDRITLKFLGAISREYIDQMVDSLTFDWIDSTGSIVHEKRLAADFALDEKVNRRIWIDLEKDQHRWQIRTGTKLNGVSALGNVRLYLNGGTEYAVSMRDRMVPMVRSAHLKSHNLQERNLSGMTVRDTLAVELSENVFPKNDCADFLEFKSASDGSVNNLQIPNVTWNADSSAATIILIGEDSRRLMPRDSIRLRPSCVKDSAGNDASDSVGFVYVNGFYPLDFEVGSMVSSSRDVAVDAPIFQLQFKESESRFPNDEEWGIAMEVRSPEFDNAVKDAIGLKENASVDYSKLNVQYTVKIYTSLGEFVVGTSSEVNGDDDRFENTSKRLFLKWNLMDGSRRLVGTGAYIANVAVSVTYDGKIVYRSDVHHGPTTRIFGVKRRQ